MLLRRAFEHSRDAGKEEVTQESPTKRLEGSGFRVSSGICPLHSSFTLFFDSRAMGTATPRPVPSRPVHVELFLGLALSLPFVVWLP